MKAGKPLRGIAKGLAWIFVVPMVAAALPRPYTVEAYDVRIRVDIANQSLDGEATIRVRNASESAISALEFDAGGMQIASVTESQTPQYFERKAGLMAVVSANAIQPDERRALTVKYQAGPTAGLKFFPDQVYAANTSDWMPCNCQPAERSTLHLTVVAPTDMAVAVGGQLKSSHASGGQAVTEWELDSPAAPQWFGFAIGRFDERTSEAEGVKLRGLAGGPQIFEPTAAALRYLSERTGKRYAGATYTQVFVRGGAIRSMAGGLTFLPESYAQGLDKQPDALNDLAEALAHQWYGIGIASGGSKDAWLSQGIPAFLADAFVSERLGKASYEARIERARDTYNRLRGEGKDQPLSDIEWTEPEPSSDSLALAKGVLFLYLVRETLGENAFWNGLRLYTDEEWNKAAASESLQDAFAAANAGRGNTGEKRASQRKNNSRVPAKNGPKTLGNLFDMWVYGIPLGKSR